MLPQRLLRPRLTACLLGCLLAGSAAADVVLRGTVEGRVIEDNAVIPAGASTILIDTVIKGNLLVRANARVVSDKSTVDGNVQSERSTLVDLGNSTVVKGSVQAQRTRSLFVRTGTTIGGNLQVVENTTGKYDLTNNVITADLQFFKNTGAGKITGNRVGGNLQSKENTPAPLVKKNTVAGSTELE
jgi:cytoskeletal protein CcmA (bactofilin family)